MLKNVTLAKSNNFVTQIQYNLILDADSYKVDHVNQLPKPRFVQSVGVARKPNAHTDKVVVFGIQYVSQVYLTTQITKEMINEAEIEITEQGYEFPRKNWEYILEKHNGFLPIEIKAIPEGTVVPVGTAIYAIKNTDPKCYWLPSYVETIIQRSVWKMTTISSILRALREDMLHCAADTDTDLGHVEYALHNFGDRGADAHEAAIMSAIPHAAFFSGSDCLQANRYIKALYGTTKPYLSSVIASEHSTMCANADAASRDDFKSAVIMIDRLEKVINDREDGINTNIIPLVSIVCDTYDAKRFTREYIGTRLRNRIIELGQRGGKVVIRPDSGNAIDMPIEIIEILMEQFGYTISENGFKKLPAFIGVIQGDGINPTSIRQIMKKLIEKKISFSNIVFGMGGGLTHDAGRDEFSFSQKATWMIDNAGQEVDLFKDPITDIGKRSLRGEVTTYFAKDSNRIFSDRVSLKKHNPNIVDMMETVFLNGVMLKIYSFDEVRVRARKVDDYIPKIQK